MFLEVIDIDDPQTGQFEIIGNSKFEVSNLVGSWKNPYTLDIRNDRGEITGQVKISFEKMTGESEDVWTFKPHINLTDFGGYFGPTKVFLKLFRNGTVQSVLYYKED